MWYNFSQLYIVCICDTSLGSPKYLTKYTAFGVNFWSERILCWKELIFKNLRGVAYSLLLSQPKTCLQLDTHHDPQRCKIYQLIVHFLKRVFSLLFCSSKIFVLFRSTALRLTCMCVLHISKVVADYSLHLIKSCLSLYINVHRFFLSLQRQNKLLSICFNVSELL